MTEALGRNDPCWCGSGLKYKRCHLQRSTQHRLPLAAIDNRVRSAWNRRACLHQNASLETCGKIIDAHTISRSRLLGRIVDAGNHVLTFFPIRPDASGQPKLHRVGWKEASTFTGFCDKHDSATFDHIDSQEFEGASEEAFLIGYRALCHELYQKEGLIRSIPVMREHSDRGRSEDDQRHIQQSLSWLLAGANAGLRDLQRIKSQMDQALLESRFGRWSRLVLWFDGDICVVSTGAVAPDYDLGGNQLQVLHDRNTVAESLLFGLAPTATGGAVIMLWDASDLAPTRFVQSLMKLSESDLPGFVAQWVFFHIENTYFSKAWWDSLNNPQRVQISRFAANPNPYYRKDAFLRGKFVPWSVRDLQYVAGAP